MLCFQWDQSFLHSKKQFQFFDTLRIVGSPETTLWLLARNHWFTVVKIRFWLCCDKELWVSLRPHFVGEGNPFPQFLLEGPILKVLNQQLCQYLRRVRPLPEIVKQVKMWGNYSWLELKMLIAFHLVPTPLLLCPNYLGTWKIYLQLNYVSSWLHIRLTGCWLPTDWQQWRQRQIHS